MQRKDSYSQPRGYRRVHPAQEDPQADVHPTAQERRACCDIQGDPIGDNSRRGHGGTDGTICDAGSRDPVSHHAAPSDGQRHAECSAPKDPSHEVA